MNTVAIRLSQLWTFILKGIVGIFGAVNWQPPRWIIALKSSLGNRITAFRHKPLQALLLLLAVLSVCAAGGYGYHWWQTRPQPITVDFTVTAPARTELENDMPPNPLVLSFNSSVAPLALVEKEVTQGLKLTPALAGVWTWVSDTQLEFRPSQDWLIGTHYSVQLDNALVAEGIELRQWTADFDSAAFIASVEKAEFYQDPLDPALKKALFQLHFSHPVDISALEKQLTLHLNYPSKAAKDATPLTFTVTSDKLKLNATVQSQRLSIPRDDQNVTFTLNEDLQAAGSKATLSDALSTNVTIPGLFNSLSINDVQFISTPNTQTQQLDQLLVINTTLPVHEHAIAKMIEVWLLPENNPHAPEDTLPGAYHWSSDEVTAEVLKRSTRLEVQPVPAEQEFTQSSSLHIKADAKRMLLVKIDKQLQSFGGYQLPEIYYTTLAVPDPTLQKELHIMGEGSLLTLSGDKKIAVMAHDVLGVRVELGRVLPAQLHHFVSQSSGEFSHPDFSGDFGQDNLSERFTLDLPLPLQTPGKTHYQPVDLSAYMQDAQGNDKRGIFLMTTRNYDPKQTPTTDADTASEAETEATADNETEESLDADVEDKRLILVTDLGIIAKTELDGTQVVFVQSIQSGQPQVDADVQVMGKNGLVLLQGKTDAEGKVHFPKLAGLEREREPLFYLVKFQGDMSFLPLKREDRQLDFSRFDVGGATNVVDAQQLNAYLFSDRGIYRPGDTFNIGLIVKTEGWGMPLLGLPLEAEILDPRGLAVKRIKLQLAAGGFNELAYQTLDTAPTGNYSVNLYTVKDNQPDQQLGSTQVKVEEFQPDRMKAVATFSKPSVEGWVHPDDLQLTVDVQNLYGAPAEAGRVEASMTLKPVLPAFKRFKDYSFHDPHYAKEGFEETLSPQQTDTNGHAAFALDLQKYTRASYQLHVLARAFEAEGGRSVATDASILVSDMPYLLGYKADGALDFVAKDALRNVQLLAIDPTIQAIAAEHLSLELVERKVLSVLIHQEDGTYRYESRPKEVSVRKAALSLPKAGYTLRLDSSAPGDYAYIVRNAEGLLLTRVDYRVAGQGNVSRSLDRNAELQINLDKAEYAPGDTITLNIRAPYTGAGLITIERDKVYASVWFKADTQASVQRIQIPKTLKGNAYVTVQYSRAPGSDEIFMSPLSYGVAPFKISLSEQTQALTLNVPERIKPGQTLTMQLNSSEPTRVVVFAVDEGILQVARYENPDPLGYFFKKRQLAVDTTQILDLILPEFKKLLQAAAPGGDGENDGGASFLNPFKRKHDKPAVYWSGIMEVNGDKELRYTVPDTFNGTLRVMAVAVNDARIGSVTQKTQVRGDLIVSPNAPFMVAPGDEFTVSVAVANNVPDSGDKAPVQISVNAPPQLIIQGEASKTLTIAENHEASTTFRVKSASGQQAVLGNARLSFSASTGGQSSTLHSDLSIRPAVPKIASLRFGSFRSTQDIAIERLLYPELRKVSAGLSPLPLVAMPGLIGYLENFEHSCTEQLISKAMPMLVLSKHPEFAADTATKITDADFVRLLSVLRTRQNAEGGFGLWTASPQAHEFASVYAAHFLIDALASGLNVPEDMLQKSLDYLQTLAASPATDLYGIRTRAYAAYLLTRQGTVTTTLLANLRETLRNRYKDAEWHNDSSAVYLAASYQLLKQAKLADELIKTPVQQLGQDTANYRYQDYYDPLIHDGQLIYLLAKHFPQQLQHLSPTAFQTIAKSLQDNRYNTLSSAYLLLAYHAYLGVVATDVSGQLSIAAIDANGQQQALPLPANAAPRVAFPITTKSLHFAGPSGIPLYYAVAESGYDQTIPTKAVSHGLEIMRAYLNAAGKTVDHVSLGEELTVQLRIRATERDGIGNIAVQDLLPGGFEPVIQTLARPEAENAADTEASALPAWQDRLATGGNWQADYADIREDRIVLYGTVWQKLAEYHYKIKATSAGVFNVPPIYAESLYEKNLQAQSSAGVIRVDEREQKTANNP